LNRRKAVSGIGIDAVELRRAARFVRSHKSRLGSVLHPHELRLVCKSRSTSVAFAVLFALKEAASKSLGVRIDHPRQFLRFSIQKSGNGFRAVCKDQPGRSVDLICFRSSDGIGSFAVARGRELAR